MYKVFVFLLISTISSFGQEAAGVPETVDSVDLNRYTGLWYEIARIPNSFQDQCVANTTAFYKITEDGYIEVINSCEEEDGSIDSARGIAQVVDTVTNAKLEVSFVRFLGINLFWGDYWILGLGNNYDYAVVGTPSRKYGWILSRERNMSEELLNNAFTIFERQGYNRSKFKESEQSP
jgi:apolipoprotein D and lipocalin family protein